MKIIIQDNPIPLSRHRHTISGHTHHTRVYNPQAKIMAEIGWQAKAQFPYPPIDTPISVTMEFFVQIPKSLSNKKKLALEGKYVPKRPDCSNYIKLYEDALNGFIWQDDALIVELHAKKIYSLKPRTEILIQIIGE